MRLLMVVAIFMLGLGTGSARQVQLDVRLGKPVLLADKKQTVFMKIGLTGFKLEQGGKRTPVNVAIVLDKSGSMAGEKMRKAKEAARMAVDRLAPDDIVSIIAYDSTVRVLVPATKAVDKEQIRQGIDRISSGGNTALFAGVSKGADELRKFLDKNHVNRVVLLSDGLANVGPSSPGALNDLGRTLVQQGISVTTLGLGLDYNEDLMSSLARASDGNHAFIEHPRDLAHFFNLEFGEVLSVVAQDVSINIECAPGVRPIRVLGREADIVGQTIHSRLNQLISSRQKYVLVELEVPAGEHRSEREIAKVNVSYGNLITKATDQLSATVQASYSHTQAEVDRLIDRSVMVEAVSLIATKRNRTAVVLRDQGKIEEARNMLQMNSTYLEQSAKKYKSTKLKAFSADNVEDSKNLAPKRWRRQRKKMRRVQYKNEMQQTY